MNVASACSRNRKMSISLRISVVIVVQYLLHSMYQKERAILLYGYRRWHVTKNTSCFAHILPERSMCIDLYNFLDATEFRVKSLPQQKPSLHHIPNPITFPQLTSIKYAFIFTYRFFWLFSFMILSKQNIITISCFPDKRTTYQLN
jgi:hypothetical protein